MHPVFLPFAGCPARCVFCSQESQTGAAAPAGIASLRRILAECGKALEAARGDEAPELAFYGGTFTAQAPDALALCLEFAQEMRRRRRIVSFRCSTRPDCADEGVLRLLRESGCSLVEFGVQSFEDRALRASGRGYDGAMAREAVKLAKSAGLCAGVQLMPGMPGMSAAAFLEDVRTAAELGADALRFYPCQVLEGTPLAALWRRGAYRPWSLALTVRLLARGLLCAHAARIPVIRIGLAPQAGFAPLAGPSHPALGSLVQARALPLGALRLAASAGAKNLAGFELLLPRAAQGYRLGPRNALLPLWKRLGMDSDRFAFWEKPLLALRPRG